MARMTLEHIQLQGSVGFIAHTREALVCLRTADSHAQVWGLLAVLRKAKRSGVHAHAALPVIDVGRTVWNSPTVWYASGIGHEGFHIKLYREAKAQNREQEPDVNTWAGAEAEKRCLAFQLLVLQELRASDWYLDYVRELMKSPNYMGDPFSMKDYLRRNW